MVQSINSFINHDKVNLNNIYEDLTINIKLVEQNCQITNLILKF